MFRIGCVCRSRTFDNAVLAGINLMKDHKGSFGVEILEKALFDPRNIVQKSSTELVFNLKSSPMLANAVHSVHGGSLCALADTLTSLHVRSVQVSEKLFSVSFNISYFAALAEQGEFMLISDLVRLGKRMAFVDFSFVDKEHEVTYCSGSHILTVMDTT